MVGVSDSIAGQVPVAVVKLPVGIDKPAVAKKTLILGPTFALGGIYTLEELGLETFPVTTLGKPKKSVLSSLVEEHRRQLSEHAARSVSHSVHEGLVASLIDAWEQVTATRPRRDQDVLYLADSISMLRFCDAVIRLCGKHIYLQDLVNHNTVDKQAELLAGRKRDATRTYVGIDSNATAKNAPIFINDQLESVSDMPLASAVEKPCISACSRQSWLDLAAQSFANLNISHSEVEAAIPIRASLRRFTIGQRPQSYHVAFSFRVPGISVSRLHQALGQLVAHHQLLRSVLCLDKKTESFHAVPVYGDALLSHFIFDDQVSTTEQAVNYAGGLPKEAHATDFMLRASVIRCEEDSSNYLSLILNHSIMDAVAAVPWYRDLDMMLHDDTVVLSSMTPYKLFADLHYDLAGSHAAQEAVSFHVKRLRGISRLKHALWPHQRAPGWMISDDAGSPYALKRELVRESVWKGRWNSVSAQFNTPRISRLVDLSQLPSQLNRLGLTAPNFTKAAIALLTTLQTNASHAVFTSWESSRSWPFVPRWVADRLPPAMGIDGPTLEWVLNMPEVDLNETVADYLKRMEHEQRQMSAYEHAPWSAIAHGLQEEALVAMEASFRQAFVWDVSLLGMVQPKGYLTDFKILEPVNRHNWADW